jgi:hypothetical protein
MHVHSVVSRGKLMQQACESVTLASLSSSFTEGVATITVWELSMRLCVGFGALCSSLLYVFLCVLFLNEHSGAAKHTAGKNTTH